MNMKYRLNIIGLLALAFLVSCHSREEYVQRTVPLKRYERFNNDTTAKYIYLKVLKVYPAQSTCIGDDKYANLYIARLLNGQSLYVFEFCSKVPEHIDDTTGRYPPIIDTSSILKDKEDKVIIFVPKDFSLPAGAKYVFATVGTLGES
jgi:hypothetical protein